MTGVEHVWRYWVSGGGVLLPLAAVSFCILLLVVRTQLVTRRLLQEGRVLQAWLRDRVEPMDIGTLQNVLPRNDFATVFLRALLHIAETGRSPMETLEVCESVAMQCVRKDMVMLAALTAAAPLLGLLGTVGGMIATFEAVSAVSGQTGTRVAGGISQALITTQFGLVVAMPGVFGMAHLRQATRDVQLLLGDCRAHLVALLGGLPQSDPLRSAA